MTSPKAQKSPSEHSARRNILILGPGRSGKTTLAGMLRAALPSANLIHTDAVRAAFMKGLPGRFPAEILNYETSTYYEDFLYQLFLEQTKQDQQTTMNKRTYQDQHTSPHVLILEGSHLSPAYLAAHPLDADIIFLGHGDLDAKKLLALIRANDTEKDWSASLTDAELLDKCRYFASENQKIRASCQKHGFAYFDTSSDRPAVLAKILRKIIKKAPEGARQS